MSPTQIGVVANGIIVVDPGADSVILVLDPLTGAVRQSFGGSGKGATSLAGLWSFDRVPGDANKLWAYDFAKHQFDLLSIDDGSPVQSKITLQLSRTLTGAVWEQGRILSPAFGDSGRFATFSSNGAFTGYSGPTPTGSPDTPLAVIQHGYQATVTSDPNHHYIALADRHADIIEIYDSFGRNKRIAQRPFHFDPTYRVVSTQSGPIMAETDDTRFGYLDVTSDAAHIVALFSGRRFGSDPNSAWQANYIHVFGWNGELLCVFRTDADLISIAYDVQSRTLFGLQTGTDPQIHAYDLNLSVCDAKPVKPSTSPKHRRAKRIRTSSAQGAT
jgi:hypothetical protein